jgi:hypothetical protein
MQNNAFIGKYSGSSFKSSPNELKVPIFQNKFCKVLELTWVTFIN